MGIVSFQDPKALNHERSLCAFEKTEILNSGMIH